MSNVENAVAVIADGDDSGPVHECEQCGAAYYGEDAARDCCLVTDGGETAEESDRVDPEDLPDTFTPAVVHFREDAPAFVADYTTLSSGWVAVRAWWGERIKLPPRRVLSISEIHTEPAAPPTEDYRPRRVADEDRRQQARDAIPGTIPGTPMSDDVDRGEGIRTDGGLNPSDSTPGSTIYVCEEGHVHVATARPTVRLSPGQAEECVEKLYDAAQEARDV